MIYIGLIVLLFGIELVYLKLLIDKSSTNQIVGLTLLSLERGGIIFQLH
jgi:hypothetical protein